MGLIPGICTQCGATISVDNHKDAMVCPYCNTPFIVEKAIHQFNITYSITNNITANNVIIQNVEKDFEIIGGELKRYKGESRDVVIPDNVYSIGTSAFYESDIRSVKIPGSVRTIKKFAFYRCKELENVDISEGLLTIEGESGYPVSGPFDGCSKLKKIRLPKTLRNLSGRVGNYIETIYISSETLKSDGYDKMCWRDSWNLYNIYVDEKLVENSEMLLEYFPEAAPTAIYIRRTEKSKKWETQGLCKFCGGKMKGFFSPQSCAVCGKKQTEILNFDDVKHIDL